MRKLIDKILAVDRERIRFASIVNSKENTMMSDHNPGVISFVSPHQEELFAIDLQKIRTMQEFFDEMLGKVAKMHVYRQRLHQLIFYVEGLIIYVTCHKETDEEDLVRISKRIEFILKGSTATSDKENATG